MDYSKTNRWRPRLSLMTSLLLMFFAGSLWGLLEQRYEWVLWRKFEIQVPAIIGSHREAGACLSSDNRRLFLRARDATGYLFDVESGTLLWSHKFDSLDYDRCGNNNAGAAFVENDQYVSVAKAWGEERTSRRLLRVSDGVLMPVNAPEKRPDGFHNPSRPLANLNTAFSADGTQILTRGSERATHGWELSKERKCVARISGGYEPRGCCFSPDGTLIATVSYGNTLNIYDTLDGSVVAAIKPGHNFRLVEFTPDGTVLLVTHKNWGAQLYRKEFAGLAWDFSKSSALLVTGILGVLLLGNLVWVWRCRVN